MTIELLEQITKARTEARQREVAYRERTMKTNQNKHIVVAVIVSAMARAYWQPKGKVQRCDVTDNGEYHRAFCIPIEGLGIMTLLDATHIFLSGQKANYVTFSSPGNAAATFFEEHEKKVTKWADENYDTYMRELTPRFVTPRFVFAHEPY